MNEDHLEQAEVVEEALIAVNKKTGEIVVGGSPEEMLLRARDAAQALERVIELNDKPPLLFNGKRYLEFHHWQVAAKFYGCTVKTFDAQPIEIGGVHGFKAKAEVIDEKTGLSVGSAESFCMRDEKSWKDKPTFQLASMAQTRAASKALSNKFRFVAVVAGYAGTPAEEMGTEPEATQRQVVMPKAKAKVSPQAEGTADGPADPMMLQAPPKWTGQSKFFAQLHASVRRKNIPEETMKTIIAQLFHKGSSKDLTDAETAQLIKVVEGM